VSGSAPPSSCRLRAAALDPRVARARRGGQGKARGRGALHWLPMHSFSNDLVFAMWWFVWGSIFTTVIPIIPLIALSENLFWETPDLAPKTEHEGLYVSQTHSSIPVSTS
jgi:hypothetical protein